MSIYQSLNDPQKENRLDALKSFMAEQNNKPQQKENDVNNHIHTFYSFSPYSPTHAAYSAYQAGLSVAGIVDHDTVSGIKEFHEAAKIIGLASTGGAEVRVKFSRFHRTLNNPDQIDVMYMVAHGIPLKHIKAFQSFLKPYLAHRETRNKKMVDKINQLIIPAGFQLDYALDVRSLSKASEGGSVTERHILYALSKKLLNHYKDVYKLMDYIEQTFQIKITDKHKKLLTDTTNKLLTYDLLGVLKTNTKQFFIPATDELSDAKTFVEFAIKHGAIPAYAYLGDVKDSVTGDKRAQKFEDDYLEELFIALKEIGVPAIAYMPTRNTPEQIMRLQALAKTYDMIEISGEDINSPRQSFNCDAYENPTHKHLIDSAWALVGHEALYNENPEHGLLGKTYQHMPIKERIKYFSTYARKMRKNI